jgi:hypothetical protein
LASKLIFELALAGIPISLKKKHIISLGAAAHAVCRGESQDQLQCENCTIARHNSEYTYSNSERSHYNTRVTPSLQ